MLKELKEGEDLIISEDIIKKYLCPNADSRETFMFIQLCRTQNLNPFIGEAFLIKYSPRERAQIVVSKYAFLKRAERHPSYKGFKAGIIVEANDGKVKYKEGSFCHSSEKLLGGWAEILREDREFPIRSEVALHEYCKKTNNWQTMPATMIRKVALAQGLREAFPEELGGLYIPEEGIVPEVVEAVEATEEFPSGDGANPEGVEAGENGAGNPEAGNGEPVAGDPEGVEDGNGAEPPEVEAGKDASQLLEEVKKIKNINELKNWWFNNKPIIDELPEEEKANIFKSVKEKKEELEHV